MLHILPRIPKTSKKNLKQLIEALKLRKPQNQFDLPWNGVDWVSWYSKGIKGIDKRTESKGWKYETIIIE